MPVVTQAWRGKTAQAVILEILEANRKPHQPLGDTRCFALFGCQPPMSRLVEASAAISPTAFSGLEGVSIKSILAGGWAAARH